MLKNNKHYYEYIIVIICYCYYLFKIFIKKNIMPLFHCKIKMSI